MLMDHTPTRMEQLQFVKKQLIEELQFEPIILVIYLLLYFIKPRVLSHCFHSLILTNLYR